jgi:hypothetical protein
MISICQGRRRSPLKPLAASGCLWSSKELELLRVFLASQRGFPMEQDQIFIAVSGASPSRKISLNSSAGFETTKSEASEFLPCPIRDRAKSGRSRSTTSTSFACPRLELKWAFRRAVRSFVCSDPPLRGRPRSFSQGLRCRGYDLLLFLAFVKKGKFRVPTSGHLDRLNDGSLQVFAACLEIGLRCVLPPELCSAPHKPQ